jgi:hypothetical protein
MSDATTGRDPEDDEEWQFALDEVGPEGQIEAEESIEPGEPKLENVLFVLLGIALTLWILWSTFANPAG